MPDFKSKYIQRLPNYKSNYHYANRDFNHLMNDLINHAREKQPLILDIEFSKDLSSKITDGLLGIIAKLNFEDLKNFHEREEILVELYKSLPRNIELRDLKKKAKALRTLGKKTDTDEEITRTFFVENSGLDKEHALLIYEILRHSPLGGVIRSIAIKKCFDTAYEETLAISIESDRIMKFKEELIKLVTPVLKYYHSDNTDTPYQMTSYCLQFNESVDLMIREIKAIDDKRIRCLDLSKWGVLPSANFLKQIPPNIDKIIYPGINLGDMNGKALQLTWLPPHIKSIEFSRVNTPLFIFRTGGIFDCTSDSKRSPRQELIQRSLYDNLPFTLRQVEGLRGDYEIPKPPSFPASYTTVFENRPEASVIEKMHNLLLHYLGKDSKSLADGSIKTWSRTNWRDHRAEVETMIQRIQRNEFNEPIELLNALKEIAQDANPHGGLQRRIDYFSDYLATQPEEAQVLQAVGPSCSSH